MISIIICSRNKTLLNTVSQSIKETIGVPYEIIAIDNIEAKYGICKAYNLGATQAKFDIFCFMHEDITFETQNWGQNVVNHLSDESVGLVGVMGAYPILKVPSCYLSEVLLAESNLIQVDPNTKQDLEAFLTTNPDDKSVLKNVSAIDGILMITRRNVFNEFQFDDKLLTGFHGYDIEYSLQVLSRYNLCVAFDLKLKHYFNTKLNKQYITETIKVYKKWQKFLPVTITPFTNAEYANFHWLAINRLMELIIGFDFSMRFTLKQYFYFSFNRFFRLKPFLKIFKNLLIPKIYSKARGYIKVKS